MDQMKHLRPAALIATTLLVAVYCPGLHGKLQGQDTAAVAKAAASGIDSLDIDYWVTQLSHSHYLRRETAEQKLTEAGPDAVKDLAAVMLDGDLEAIERASSALTQIAIDHHPSKDGGAWQNLADLSNSTTGLIAASTRRAADEIRRQRGSQALAELRAAGVFVGVADFMIRAVSEPKIVAQIDDKWNQDIAALDWLRWLNSVDSIKLVGPAINKDVLKRVSQMPDLKSLAMEDGMLAPEDLEALKQVRTMRSLDLRYVELSKEVSTVVASLPIRDSITLMGTGTSDADVESMKAAAPGVTIEHKKGGFLGVKCMDRAAACEITEVVAASAAEQAGLIRGDVIVKIGDAVVEQFSDLQAKVNQHFAGDEMELNYLRGGQLQTTKVKLRRLIDR
ncbi:serine endoprotease [Rubripirellula obstinata]|uniref:Serine endoprotease n=1 Tax=Rubripirellula obstinata TaxID=406547 RepID=A0A5B1CNN4_9BACT|nr:PDZ domain-containing protein [Rubripirellula obstinata]KAA1262146.1 serine endoprotease [Rubripirellula obstinata]